MSEEQVILIVLSLMIFAGVAVLWLAMANRRALREMEHRERIAMIQAGMVPAPEADPLAFEAQLETPSTSLSRKDRWRTAGTLTVGFGLALGVLLTFVGEEGSGFAVGGAFAGPGCVVPSEWRAAEHTGVPGRWCAGRAPRHRLAHHLPRRSRWRRRRW